LDEVSSSVDITTDMLMHTRCLRGICWSNYHCDCTSAGHDS
jgi:hypothetical protein